MPLALRILVERYGLDQNPPKPRSIFEVARAHGLTPLQLRQIEGRALVALERVSLGSPARARLHAQRAARARRP